MSDPVDILRLRVLLTFLEDDDTCTVMGISRTLNETKQTISRILISLEKEGLIDRSNRRRPVLTDMGQRMAFLYGERIHISLSHLMYEGVNVESAKRDAYRWALYNTDDTMKVIRSAEEKNRVKYELRKQPRFSGTDLCKQLKGGEYRFPFIIYREHVHNGSNISMANEGFEHPCTLSVKDGVGTVQLKTLELTRISAATGKRMRGIIKSLKYFDSGSFIGAEKNGNLLSFPASILSFINIGEGMGQLLHGIACVKMKSSVDVVHMPNAAAVFAILI